MQKTFNVQLYEKKLLLTRRSSSRAALKWDSIDLWHRCFDIVDVEAAFKQKKKNMGI